VFLVLVHALSLFSQESKSKADSLVIINDTLRIDTIPKNIHRSSSSAIQSKVTYSAKDKIKKDLINKTMILTNKAIVNYEDIEIKADSIVIDMKTNLLFAAGRRDSTGKIVGKPVFSQGSQLINADELTYNFKTKRAYATNIITKQADGLLHSGFTKLLEDKTSNISKSTYSTCDADTPHFYINLPRAKVYPGKKIISGPGNLVLEGIPLPLVIPQD
jgi:lipopolysaccharide assembly outer membrane protein LptD (OstA)